ncbi:hypothetical protein [Desulfurobacterium indicum]|nr:hypothetical protein [Desulfurobacterium indicum]
MRDTKLSHEIFERKFMRVRDTIRIYKTTFERPILEEREMYPEENIHIRR